MLETINRFCCRFPWLVFLAAALVTVFMAQQIREKAYFEADMVKFLPTDMPAVKSDDYSKKNFNIQDTMLIGVEKKEGSVLEPEVLRAMEQIILELKGLKAPKTFDSVLKGETVTLTQRVGIDPDGIRSIANLEDAILDQSTQSVVSGSVIEKLKKDAGIESPPGKEERLPKSDADLRKIIPGLKERVMQDRTFRNNLLSTDFHAATISVDTLRKQDYKRRYALLELSTAIDPDALTRRFKGGDSTFGFEIYDQTLDGNEINREYIETHSRRVREDLHSYLVETLQPVFPDEPQLEQLLNKRFDTESFEAVMRYVERNDFFMHPDIGTGRSFTDGLYEFMLEEIDPYSRENLEFQIHDVQDMVDMAEIYYLTRDILAKHRPDGVNTYVAGTPVVIGVFSQMMNADMQRLIPIALAVVVVILILSFRSLMGVFIPFITVSLAVVWTLGIMAMLAIPFTVSTSGLPIVILAVGTAYGIHLINRYYEDVRTGRDKFTIVQTSIKHVGGAIVMAAVTTIAGFSSLATTSLTAIKHFGQFSAVGVLIALLLTLTLTPAMLVLWRLPRASRMQKDTSTGQSGMIAPLMHRWSRFVIRHQTAVLFVFLAVIGIAIFLMRSNHFEGSMMSNFKEDNVIFKSDRFLNKHLTGTTDVNLIFSYRDQIHLESTDAQQQLTERVVRFVEVSENLPLDPQHASRDLLLALSESLQQSVQTLPESTDKLLSDIALLEDILNEEYRVFSETQATATSESQTGTTSQQDMEALTELDSTDSLESLAESESSESLESLAEPEADTLDELADLGDGGLESLADTAPSSFGEAAYASLSEDQLTGIKDIHARLNREEGAWQRTADAVVRLRSVKSSAEGKEWVKRFNLLKDYLAVDVKQPIVLHKLERLYQFLSEMESPQVEIEGDIYKPTGLIVTPVDYVRRFYKVFYHNDDPAYDRLPDVDRDGFTDKTLTDRSIIGVVLNQALSADRDGFEMLVTPDLTEFQVKIMMRDGSSTTLDSYVSKTMGKVRELFPEDDPYIGTIRTGGGSFTTMQIATLIGSSQLRSIALSFLFVFIVTFFIFRSFVGGLYSLIPLLFTVLLNFGFLAILGGEITMSTMLVASVAIGIGVDYTIHLLERLKIQLRLGDTLEEAYVNTITTSGRAILVNATAVAAGFLVFLASTFDSQIMLGTLVAATMLFSSLGALTLLPAVILKTNPSFLAKLSQASD